MPESAITNKYAVTIITEWAFNYLKVFSYRIIRLTNMPINAGPEYARAQEEYFKASTTEEKIAGLKKMITTAPKHKGSEKLLQQLKRSLSDLKKAQIKEKKAGKGKRFAIKKEGAATVVFISVPDSGKSKLFSNLTE
ncbi:MAG: hypothetical protein NTY99_00060, partial [DPANN group archaeon]|nr:hypothetical protein [DPANN group archaeon]